MPPNPAQDDSALVRAARSEPGAFNILYDRYVQRLYHYCYHRTNNKHDAEDLTSQTFLAALEALPKYRQDGHFAAWLFTIARNKVTDFHRERLGLPLEETRLPPFPSDLAGEAESSAEKRSLLRLLEELDEDEQELIRLRFVAELPFAEIAKALHKKEDAVKRNLYRLLARLKSRLEAEHE